MGDLLNASKFKQGQLHLNKTKFKIVQIIEECSEHINLEGKYKVIVTGDKELEVNADMERVGQVISNFIGNAIKYAPTSRNITCHITELDDCVKIAVIDSGLGISADKVPHLFERFYRVDSSGSQYSGLGLGLYISSEIIKRHDGEIGVDSTEGEGSSFWFTLPN